MGFQPGLDGLRAVSVVAVILYHAGFSWLHGGFFGVEVFFVVSGFLITSLLLEERERDAGISLRGFWTRRARRLLPALGVVLVATAVWALLFGSAEQQWQLRRDLPWAIFYVANWGQILGDVPYFAAGDPPLLRHLWSLAVEEQWYLLWPLVFLGLTRSRLTTGRIAGILAVSAVAVMVFTAWIAVGDSPLLGGPPALFEGSDRVNFAYLSTITRSSGLLLGAAAAFVWRPWRAAARASGATEGDGRSAATGPGRVLDLSAGIALGLLASAAIGGSITSSSTYRWVMPLVSIASLVAVLVVVHPAATGTRRLLSVPWLVAIGARSYGLYLWHWPIFVVLGATDGSVSRFVIAAAITAVVSEACYRYVETPVRRGALGRWVAASRQTGSRAPVGALAATALVTAGLGVAYLNVERFDVSVGGEATFELAVEPATPVSDTSAAGSTSDAEVTETTEVSATDPTASAPATTVAPTTTAAVLPRRVAIVGDSQAHSLAVNLPDGIESTFDIVRGAVDGCSVYDQGNVVSARNGFRNSFSICEGWEQEWAEAATGADVALVVLGAWDVFDLQIDGTTYPFASPEADELFRRQLGIGIDAMSAVGAEVALLEVPCMRPQDVEGAGVPALPERGDDARVAHVNDLLRQVAAANPGRVTFVEGPDEWCADEAIAADLGYRWDGVHVYKPGANLIYTSIADDLLAIPVG
jgi:peptidoglycan/LPS O-acetylase OafA/YrhL